MSSILTGSIIIITQKFQAPYESKTTSSFYIIKLTTIINLKLHKLQKWLLWDQFIAIKLNKGNIEKKRFREFASCNLSNAVESVRILCAAYGIKGLHWEFTVKPILMINQHSWQ